MARPTLAIGRGVRPEARSLGGSGFSFRGDHARRNLDNSPGADSPRGCPEISLCRRGSAEAGARCKGESPRWRGAVERPPPFPENEEEPDRLR